MITPLDIQNKEFSKAVRGYKEEEVDEFLDLLTVDLEKVITENARMKAEIARLSKDLEKYKSSEDAVLGTLEAAKALMGDISASAEKRAEILLKNAELDAELIQREARESVERLTEQTVDLRNRFTSFQSRYKNMLEAELERFDTLSGELFSQFSLDDLKIAPLSKSKTKNTTADSFSTRCAQTVNEDEDMSKTMINIRIED